MMMGRLWNVIAVGTLVFVAGAWAGLQQADQPVPTEVTEYASALVERVEATLDISAELDAAQDEIWTVVRTDGHAARAWQIEPELMQDAPRRPVLEYLSRRAQVAVVCGGLFLSQFDLSTLDLGTLDREVQANWSPDMIRSETGLHMSWDCAILLDVAGRPFRIRRRADLRAGLSIASEVQRAVRYVFPFSGNLSTGGPSWLGDESARRTFQANKDYLNEQYGQGPWEVPMFAEETGLPDGMSVYEQRVMNLNAYIGIEEEGEARLIFVAPLSH